MRVSALGDGVVELDHPGHDVDTLRSALARGFAREGWRRVQVLVDPGDPVAHRTAARSGMRQEGVLRGVGPGGTDRVLMARLAGDPVPESREGFLGVLDTTLPTKRAIAQTLLRAPDGRVLLCETTYKREWDLPGGVVDPGEAPSHAAAREIREELGLDLPTGDLLVVDWLPPYRGWSDALCFVFDGGTHPTALLERVEVQPREIRAVHWATLEQAVERCAPYLVTLLRHLLTAPPGGAAGGAAYLVDGRPPTG